MAGAVLAEHGGIDVTRLEISGDPATNWAGLERAHGYQSLIRTELARNPGVAEQWVTGPELLARCPDLLAVCSASFVVYVLPHSSVVRSLVKWIGGG